MIQDEMDGRIQMVIVTTFQFHGRLEASKLLTILMQLLLDVCLSLLKS